MDPDPSILKKSFIFLPGVGSTTEKRLWKEDIHDWDRFVDIEIAGPIKGDRKITCNGIIDKASDNLESRDLAYFSDLFRGSDSWRLWDTFSENAIFLDIETTGTSRYSSITVVGVYDGRDYRTAIRGKDMGKERIKEILEGAEMIVTFNGASFDLPMIEHQFPGSIPKIPHLDLRFLARKCGLTGGLKSIETQMGISRPEEVKGMSGEDAVRLWRLFERGSNRNALKLLLKYNMEDVVNLGPLTGILVKEAETRLFQ